LPLPAECDIVIVIFWLRMGCGISPDMKILLLRLLETPAARLPVEPERPKSIEFWKGSPFPGLRAFLPASAPIFFGRGRETDAQAKRTANDSGTSAAEGNGSPNVAGGRPMQADHGGFLPKVRLTQTFRKRTLTLTIFEHLSCFYRFCKHA